MFASGCNKRVKSRGRYLLQLIGDNKYYDRYFTVSDGVLSPLAVDKLRLDEITPGSLMLAAGGDLFTFTQGQIEKLFLFSRRNDSSQKELASNVTEGRAQSAAISDDGTTAYGIVTLSTTREFAVWRWNLLTSENRRISPWYPPPSWLARPVFSQADRCIFYLHAVPAQGGLNVSLLRQTDDGDAIAVAPDRQVAAFAVGQRGGLALWTQNGLEIGTGNGAFKKAGASDSILSSEDKIGPSGIAFDEDTRTVTLAVCDTRKHVAKVLEVRATGDVVQISSFKHARAISVQSF